MTDLFAEVDEIMRQERLTKIWQENKNYIIGAIAGAIILTGIMSAYTSWNTHVQSEQTGTAFELIEADNFPANIQPDDIKLRPSLKAMVLLQAAAAHLESDETDQAKALYGYIAKNIKGANKYRDLALLMTANLEKQPDALKPVLKNKNNLWRPEALLEAAAFEATENKNYEGALKHLEKIIDTPDLPTTLYQKAEALRHVYTIQQAQTAQE